MAWLTALAALGCSAQAVRPEELALTRLGAVEALFAQQSGLVEGADYVVRDRATWEDIWTRINRRRRPIPPVPPVDFTTQIALVVALGQQRSGGYGITIERAEREDGYIVVHVTDRSPASDCIVTTALTAPVDIALVPGRDLPVRFEHEAATEACR